MFMYCTLLPLYSIQLVSVFPGHQQTSSPCTLHRTQQEVRMLMSITVADVFLYLRSILSYIYMKPHVVLFTDVCDFIDGIEGSVDGGTSGGIHKHRNIPLQPENIAGKNKTLVTIWAEFKLCCVHSLSVIADIKENTFLK